MLENGRPSSLTHGNLLDLAQAVLLVTLFLVLSGLAHAQAWKLVWRDEFNGPRGTGVDPAKWAAQTGGLGWGNKELEYYTAGTNNAYMDGAGSLVIKAIKETLPQSHSCWYGPCQYTSARLITKNKFNQAYGRFEARIKMPYGQGIWPAFWMLGNNIDEARWPTCGEIDIMENIGSEPSIVHGTIHGPGYSGAGGIGAPYTLPGGQRFKDDYHIFAVEWEPNVIRWYVDHELYQTRTPADLPAGTNWVFDHPFFIILNLAVGGGWPGNPDATTAFPQTMLVDYVRVYRRRMGRRTRSKSSHMRKEQKFHALRRRRRQGQIRFGQASDIRLTNPTSHSRFIWLTAFTSNLTAAVLKRQAVGVDSASPQV